MKLVYAPSGKRMIPYPPVGPAVLAGALSNIGMEEVHIVDLEMQMWGLHGAGVHLPIYDGKINPWEVLIAEITPEISEYQRILLESAHLQAGEPLGISVMGFEQLASALLLARAALANGCAVIIGGQFWSEASANRVLQTLKSDFLTITVGDGWAAIVAWVADHISVPVNSYGWRDGSVIAGAIQEGKATPPLPDYKTVDWNAYIQYSARVFRDARPIKRAHVYVWDKKCPYKCAFCRVSSGSDAKLIKPEIVANMFTQLVAEGISQFNFMTNELNPSLKYMRALIAAIQRKELDLQDVAWFTYLRPDMISREDFLSLRSLGCRLVRYGVETGSQRLSDKMKKEYQISTITEVLHYAAEADIFNHINLLIGYPGETEDDISQTLEFLKVNRNVIHSVRINPFYLPPGSPMAKNPEEHNVKIISFNKGFYEFDLIEGSRANAKIVEDRIQRITAWLIENGIGFAGTLPFETLNIISQHKTREASIAAMKATHSYFWTESIPDVLKAKFGEYSYNETGWSNTIYQRGKNYNMTVCND